MGAQVSKASTQKGENILSNTGQSRKKKRNSVTLGDVLQYVFACPRWSPLLRSLRQCEVKCAMWWAPTDTVEPGRPGREHAGWHDRRRLIKKCGLFGAPAGLSTANLVYIFFSANFEPVRRLGVTVWFAAGTPHFGGDCRFVCCAGERAQLGRLEL